MPRRRQYATAAERQAAYRLRCHAPSPVSAATRVASRPAWRRWEAICAHARSSLEQLSREMEAYYEQRSDTWLESEQGEAFAEAKDAVAQVAEELTELTLREPTRPAPQET